MFLLAQLDSTASVAELVDIAPCDRAETMRRLFQLMRLQVIDLAAETAEERTELARQREPAPQASVREVGRGAEPSGTHKVRQQPPAQQPLHPARAARLARDFDED